MAEASKQLNFFPENSEIEGATASTSTLPLSGYEAEQAKARDLFVATYGADKLGTRDEELFAREFFNEHVGTAAIAEIKKKKGAQFSQNDIMEFLAPIIAEKWEKATEERIKVFKKTRWCFVCYKRACFMCCAHGQYVYCSPECQKVHWDSGHKVTCTFYQENGPQEEQEASGASMMEIPKLGKLIDAAQPDPEEK